MINVLLVDDEALTLELHREYVGRIAGFRVVGEASDARSAVEAVLAAPADEPVDLLLLDMTMPDGTGLDALRVLRARNSRVGVIVLTGVRDAEVVRRFLTLGAAQYLVKPFTFATFRERLEQYRDFRERSEAASGTATQEEIDAMLGALRPAGGGTLPKGLSAESLATVSQAVRAHGALSASEAAELLGMSRVTARRYLEHLADERRVERRSRYGTGGRPQSEYRWTS